MAKVTEKLINSKSTKLGHTTCLACSAVRCQRLCAPFVVQWDPLIRKSSGPDFRFSYKRALF